MSIDLYTDYLICSTEQTRATQLSRILDGHISHDQVTRFLSSQSFTDKDLWKLKKPTLRSIESEEDGVLIFNDTFIEKQWTDENEIICYHFDHSKGRSVKGINLIYHHNDISLPLSFQGPLSLNNKFTFGTLNTLKSVSKSLNASYYAPILPVSTCLVTSVGVINLIYD